MREWNRDTFCVKAFLQVLCEIEIDPPVIIGLGPGADTEIYAAIGQFKNEDLGSRISEDSVILLQLIFNQASDFVNIIRVAYADDQIDTSSPFCRVIGDVIGGQLSIGDDDSFVIRCPKLGREDVDLFHNTCNPGGLNKIFHLDGPKDNQKNACSEVCQ